MEIQTNVDVVIKHWAGISCSRRWMVGGASGTSTLLILGVQMLKDDFYGVYDLCEFLHSVFKSQCGANGYWRPTKLHHLHLKQPLLSTCYDHGCDPAMAHDKSNLLSKTGILRDSAFAEKVTFCLKSHLFWALAAIKATRRTLVLWKRQLGHLSI